MYCAPTVVEYGNASQLILGECGIGFESGLTRTKAKIRITRFCKGEEACVHHPYCSDYIDPDDCTKDSDCWT